LLPLLSVFVEIEMVDCLGCSIEAVAIGDLVASLIEEKKLRQTEIGIVAPYYKQVQKIRIVLKEKNLRDIKVGSVPEFQGKEFKALFISTVRASRHWYAFFLIPFDRF